MSAKNSHTASNTYTSPKMSIPETDFEIHSSSANRYNKPVYWSGYLSYCLVGVGFGIILVKSEIISWFRIQEMFRLQSFHMYGVIGSAVIVGMISVALIKKFRIKTIHGAPITFANKSFNKGQIIGGLIFGMGWAMTGACPGPLFAQIGTGAFVVIIVLLSAIAGTWVFGYFKERLP